MGHPAIDPKGLAVSRDVLYWILSAPVIYFMMSKPWGSVTVRRVQTNASTTAIKERKDC